MMRRTAFVLVSVPALLLLGWPAQAQGIVGWSICKLYPSRCVPPVPAPLPPPRPAPAPAPKVDAGRPMSNGPVVVKPHQAKPKVAVAKPKARVKAKAKPKAAKRKRVVKPRAVPPQRATNRDLTMNECLKLRAGSFLGYTIDDVKAAARSGGHEMSSKQIEQAKACLAGRR